MIYLLVGDDRVAKDHKTEEIRSAYLTDKDARHFDYESLDGQDLDTDALKKALVSLPAIAAKRIIHIRPADKFHDGHKRIIKDFAHSGQSHAIVILDFDKLPSNSRFKSDLGKGVKYIKLSSQKEQGDVWSVTGAMERRDPAKALKALGRLIEDGSHPLQIMPGIVWFWGSLKRRLPADSYKKGLLVLQEADLNIKRSRLKPDFALELAVTKLSSLIAC